MYLTVGERVAAPIYDPEFLASQISPSSLAFFWDGGGICGGRWGFSSWLDTLLYFSFRLRSIR